MNPPGKTSLYRMQEAARLEAERIEITQDARVRAKLQAAPRADQVALRDAFAGIERLIGVIMSDQVMLRQVQDRMKQLSLAIADAPTEVDAESADA